MVIKRINNLAKAMKTECGPMGGPIVDQKTPMNAAVQAVLASCNTENSTKWWPKGIQPCFVCTWWEQLPSPLITRGCQRLCKTIHSNEATRGNGSCPRFWRLGWLRRAFRTWAVAQTCWTACLRLKNVDPDLYQQTPRAAGHAHRKGPMSQLPPRRAICSSTRTRLSPLAPHECASEQEYNQEGRSTCWALEATLEQLTRPHTSSHKLGATSSR